MKKALIKEWMAACAACVRLVIAVNESEDSPSSLVRLRAFEEVRTHLVEEHLVMLPGYADDCPNCQEWQATIGTWDDLPLAMTPVLGREDLLHRAGHLLYDDKDQDVA